MANTSLMAEIASMVDFIKNQTSKNLIESKNSGIIEVSDEQIRKISFVVEASIGNAFTKYASQIEKKVNERWVSGI